MRVSKSILASTTLLFVIAIGYFIVDRSDQHQQDLKKFIGYTKEQLYNKRGLPKSVTYLNEQVVKFTYSDAAFIVKNGKVSAIWRS